MPRKKYISLFSGIGGLDEGLHRSGFEPLLCCELDKHAQGSLENWARLRKVNPKIISDVLEFDPLELMASFGISKGELDLLAGGPPCQSFSLAGKRKSLEDARGLLLYQMVRYASAFEPKVVLIEQVKGLKSAPGYDGKRGGALEHLISSFQGLGYSVSSQVLKASDYGVPQNRERLFIVASKLGVFRFPEKTHSDNAQSDTLFRSNIMAYRTVKDAISDLPAPVKKGQTEKIAGHLDITPNRDAERITGVPEGDYLARQLQLPDHQRMRLNPKKDTTKFRRLAWDLPSLTLRCGEAFYHPTEDRYLTPREYLRIHGFEDDHILVGPIRGRCGSVKDLDQHRQVANSVPPALAEAIGIEIQDQYFAKSRQRVLTAA